MKYPTRGIYPPSMCMYRPARLIQLTPEMLRRSHENMAKAKQEKDSLAMLAGFYNAAMRDPRLPKVLPGRTRRESVEKMAEVLRLEYEYEALKKHINDHTLTSKSAEDKKAIRNMWYALCTAKKRLAAS